MKSCRKVLDSLYLNTSENASLIMSRYIKEVDDKNGAKRDLFNAMNKAASNARDLYSIAFDMRHKALSSTAASGRFSTLQPLAIGLGNSNVIESGLALNPTYGVPILPASSIKGITAHYSSEILGVESEICDVLFGKADTESELEAGLLQFYDAWLVPECLNGAFVVDVMTPHHGDDFADPTPINFLTVKGDFELWIGCRNFEVDRKWVDFAFDLTEAALQNYGTGGKIRAGYGKMKRILSQEEIQKREAEKKRAKNIEAGFLHDEGDEVELVCVNIKHKKDRERPIFAFNDESGDKSDLRFEPALKNKVNIGDTIRAKIIRFDPSNKAYILHEI